MKRSPLLILFVTLFLDLLGFGLIIPLIAVYIQHFGGSPWVGGALLACYAAMQFVFAPIWGRISDRWGRRPVILLGLGGSAASFLAFGLAPNLPVLFAARVLAGILTAASIPAAQAYIADITLPERRSSSMALVGIAFGLGFAFGPVLGGITSKYQFPFLHTPPLSTPALVAACLCGVNFVWAFFMLPETHPDSAETRAGDKRSVLSVFPDILKALRSTETGPPLMVHAFTTFAFIAVEASFTWLVLLRFAPQLHAETRRAWLMAHAGGSWASVPQKLKLQLFDKTEAATTSNLFIIVGMTGLIVLGGIVPRLSRFIPDNRMVTIGVGAMMFSLLGIAFAGTLFEIQLLSMLLAIGSAFNDPALRAIIVHSAGPKERGAISGAQSGVGSIARIVAPPAFNLLIQVNTAIPFLCGTVLMFCSLALSTRLKPFRHELKEVEDLALAGETPAGILVEE